jgi:NADH-quinone oxidoreductase subunit F
MCVSGCVANPGVYEEPIGITLRKLVFEVAGGPRPGRTIVGAIPGGSSAAILTTDEFDTPMDFDSLRAKKSMAGSGGIIVFDDAVCMVRAAQNLIKFYAHESCGQCTPCREGTGWVHRLISKIEAGAGVLSDVDLVDKACQQMEMRTICALADGAAMSLRAVVQKFRADFVRHVEDKKCPLPSKRACSSGSSGRRCSCAAWGSSARATPSTPRSFWWPRSSSSPESTCSSPRTSSRCCKCWSTPAR